MDDRIKQALFSLGWDSFFEQAYEPYADTGYLIGRVAAEHKGYLTLITPEGVKLSEVAGKLLHKDNVIGLPKIGDWVLYEDAPYSDRAVIKVILPRKTKFSRKTAGKELKEQIIAVNIDTLFIVQGLDENYNLRRLERYLMLGRRSGAECVVLLNKADLTEEAAEKERMAVQVAGESPVILLSCVSDMGIDVLRSHIHPGRTYAFTGSSGVGKSTIINRLYGEAIQETQAVREYDSKGRHTTTRKELFVMPDGSIVIDTPGMREIQAWDEDEEGEDDSFEDIEALARHCRFRDCTHTHETHCAVKAALERGELDEARVRNFVKLRQEREALVEKQRISGRLKQKQQVKQIHKQLKQHYKFKKK